MQQSDAELQQATQTLSELNALALKLQDMFRNFRT
jgi:hypothetical protein